MSENHAEIAENQVLGAQKYKNFLGEDPMPPPHTGHFPTFPIRAEALFRSWPHHRKILKRGPDLNLDRLG